MRTPSATDSVARTALDMNMKPLPWCFRSDP
jgi:hypothetical protein